MGGGSRIRLAITRDLFLKPGPFTETEALIARQERLDGSSYPEGLSGGRITLPTRILSVADVYDALASARPHRGARTPAEALAEIRAGAGTAFDRRVVAALERGLGRRSGTSAA